MKELEQKPFKLFIPGPCEVDEEVLEALAQPVMRHYGDEWMEVYRDVISLAKQVFQTENDLFLIPGSGSAAVDMAFGSMLAEGETVAVGDNGFFGQRMAGIAASYGQRVVTFEGPLTEPLAPSALQALLEQEPDVKAVAVVHHETATTVLNPIKELAEVARAAGVPIIVDAISSLGGVPLPVDEWGIDICVTVANKCLETPPGVGLISVSPRAWELVDRDVERCNGWYLNLKTWRKFATEWASWHPYPVTLPTNNIVALRHSLRRRVETGLESHYARYRAASKAVRLGLEALGFEMVVDVEGASPIATAVRVRPEFTVKELSSYLAQEHGILIAGGLGPLAAETIRIGHMGKASSKPYLKEFLLAVEEFVRGRGIDVPEGASLMGLMEVG